jgi:hypothetical protein
MNPIFQAVMSRVVAQISSRCPVCDGRLETVSSGKHRRRRCVTCGADVPRRVSGHPTSGRPYEGGARARRPFRWPSQRRSRGRS